MAKYVHQKDIFGYDVTYGPDGEKYVHDKDIFGNDVTYGPDGDTYVHTKDIFGNNVTYGPDRTRQSSRGGYSNEGPFTANYGLNDSSSVDVPSYIGASLPSSSVASEHIGILRSVAFWLFVASTLFASLPLIAVCVKCATSSSWFPEALNGLTGITETGLFVAFVGPLIPYAVYICLILAIAMMVIEFMIDRKCARLSSLRDHDSERIAHDASCSMLASKIILVLLCGLLLSRISDELGFMPYKVTIGGISTLVISWIAVLIVSVFVMVKFEASSALFVNIASYLLLVPCWVGGARVLSLPDPTPMFMLLVALAILACYELGLFIKFIIKVIRNNKIVRSHNSI